MSDIRTVFSDFAGDWRVDGPSLAEDDGLETAVVLSLFTDRLADTTDLAADANSARTDRRGWWGDAYAEVAVDRIGSRLWTLAREKQLPVVLRRAEEYAAEALQWLVDDGVASVVSVVAELVRPGVLGLQVQIARSAQPVRRYRFDHFWKGQ